jgi:hypothetical protein
MTMSEKIKHSAVGEIVARMDQPPCSQCDNLETHLRSAKPHLILRYEPKGDNRFELTPYISQTYEGWDDVVSEGYDPDGSPLGPVYWRVVKRTGEHFYLSTYPATPDLVIRAWGPKGLAYCDPVLGFAVARIESVLAEPDDAE